MKFKYVFAKKLILISTILSSIGWSTPCSYETWDWDTVQKKAINRKTITKDYDSLTKEELGEISGCSVCEQDQVEIKISKFPAFRICKVFEDKIKNSISKIIKSSFPLTSIVGYRVGKSKGPLNSLGQRTQFSNHSYGTAIDFNSETNGLYDNCIKFGPECRLIRGGEYRPGSLGSISKNSVVYLSLIEAGFKWGGEIESRQKDFMHFSLSGM